jgi:hypothetical protein
MAGISFPVDHEKILTTKREKETLTSSGCFETCRPMMLCEPVPFSDIFPLVKLLCSTFVKRVFWQAYCDNMHVSPRL